MHRAPCEPDRGIERGGARWGRIPEEVLTSALVHEDGRAARVEVTEARYIIHLRVDDDPLERKRKRQDTRGATRENRTRTKLCSVLCWHGGAA